MLYFTREFNNILIGVLLLLILFHQNIISRKANYFSALIAISATLILCFLLNSYTAFVILDLAVCVIYCLALLDSPICDRLISSLLIYILSSITYQTVSLCYSLFPVPHAPANLEHTVFHIAAIGILLCILLICYHKQYMISLNRKNNVLLCICAGYLSILISIIHHFSAHISQPLFLLFNCVCLIAVFAVILYLISSSQRNYEKQLQYWQNTQLHTLTAYYDQLQQNAVQIRKIKHDITNHLEILTLLIQQDQFADARNYLTNLHSYTTKTPHTLPDTGNMLINAILLQKEMEYPSISIQHSGHVEAALPITDCDLCSILFNALDNALEYSATNHFKQITFQYYQDSSVLMFFITNFITAPVPVEQLGHYTSKSQKGHGFGISIIKELVQKYHGTLAFTQDRNSFTVKIQFWS